MRHRRRNRSMNKAQFREVSRALVPAMTDAKFNKLWNEFLLEKARRAEHD